jgi:hypothetical protein
MLLFSEPLVLVPSPPSYKEGEGREVDPTEAVFI